MIPDSLFHDLRDGWRAVRARRESSLLAVAILALAIGATTAIFTLYASAGAEAGAAAVASASAAGAGGIDAAAFIAAPLLLLAPALAASLAPAWRAMRIDPMRALRQD